MRVFAGRLTQDGFLNELTKLMTASKESGKGSVQISFKRYTPPTEDKEDSKPHQPKKKAAVGTGEPACLVRARLGDKKISTLVPFKDHVRFQQQFGTIMRVQLDGLKKREKRKKGGADAGPISSPKKGPSSPTRKSHGDGHPSSPTRPDRATATTRSLSPMKLSSSS